MHVPDGFFNAGASVAAGAASMGWLAVAVRRTREVLADRQVPLAALVAAFVFAVQMLNFPVAGGTSGHLLGGTLAAVLVGPWIGAIAVSVVVVVQLLFADGGVTALGINLLLIALVPASGGWLAFRALCTAVPRRREWVAAAAGLAAFGSVVAASAVFTLLYAAGGAADVAFGRLAAAMVGTHVLVGIGEGLITALTVSSVLATRPDLVHGAGALEPPATLSGGAVAGE